jgi:hypothetical protein
LACCRALLLLALPGCLVSFNDYPLGDPQSAPSSSGGKSATSTGGKASSAESGGGGVSSGGTSVFPSSGSSMVGENDAGSPDPGTGGSSTVGPNPLLIDDFEDGDAAILVLQGRSGSWYVANDGKGQQTPPSGMPLAPSTLAPSRGASAHGAHTFGGPFLTWGALIGTTLASSGDSGVAYDVSSHQGVRLWVRYGGAFPNPAKQVRLNLRTPATITGGSCTVCSDHFGAAIPLTAQWVQVEVPFTGLKQTGYGRPLLGSPDLKRAMGIELLFPVNVAFDLWIDDVEFY